MQCIYVSYDSWSKTVHSLVTIDCLVFVMDMLYLM
jgi:hypothetical protein